VIEERGRNLSLGEKQLVCLARCLLQNAPVVIMDEATSSIDPKSEEILVKATEEFFAGRTQLIIAHRLSTLRSCDRVMWLRNGKIEMIGKPTEVLPIFERSRLDLESVVPGSSRKKPEL
jgi:ABC-type multidrug transport system fused ATPase/permease subunit